jgi:hypothetical protein
LIGLTPAVSFSNVLSLDGTNDYVSVPDSPSLDITGMITLSSWVKLDAFTLNGKIIIKPVAGRADPWELYSMDVQTNGTVRFILSNGSLYSQGGWQSVASSSAITLNEWHHVLGTYDGSSMKIYVDGSLAGPRLPYIDVTSQNLLIGSSLSGNYQRDGRRRRIYNTSLSASGILEIYGERISRIPQSAQGRSANDGCGTAAGLAPSRMPPRSAMRVTSA